MKRIETFVFEFDSQEAFSEFFSKYYRNKQPGILARGASIGNLIEKIDTAEQLLWDFAEKLGLESELAERIEKFLES